MPPVIPAAGFVVLVVLVAGLPLGVWARGAGRSLWPSRAAGSQARIHERTTMSDFYDWDPEDRGALYDRAEEETGTSWYDLSGEERAAYIESEERRRCS